MRLKGAISSLILAIYLVASCGGMLSVILCHCDHSQHYKTLHHCCSEHHCCLHNDGEGIKLPMGCNCLHDHSTEVDLYNCEKSLIFSHIPVICTTLHQMQEPSDFDTNHTIAKHFERRKIPLPESEFAAIQGLRAPPVIA